MEELVQFITGGSSSFTPEMVVRLLLFYMLLEFLGNLVHAFGGSVR